MSRGRVSTDEVASSGKKVGLDELEEALDFAPALGVVGRAQDALDAQGGADGVELLGGVDLALVDVDGQGAAVAEHGPFEAILQAGELLVPVELGVGDQAGVVVEEGEEEDLALLVGVGRVGQLGAVHGVALPQVAKVGALEAAVGLGPLLGQELGRRGVAQGQLAAQGAGRNRLLGDGLRGVHAQGLDDGAGRAVGLLALEGFGPVEGLGRDGAGLAPVAAGFGLEAVKAVLVVAAFPAGQGGHADGAAGGVGDLVVAGGDLLPQPALAAGLVVAPQQGQDERVPEQRNLGAPFFGIDSVGHGFTSVLKYGPSIAAGQAREKMRNSVGGGVGAGCSGGRFGGQIA